MGGSPQRAAQVGYAGIDTDHLIHQLAQGCRVGEVLDQGAKMLEAGIGVEGFLVAVAKFFLQTDVVNTLRQVGQ